MVRNIKKEHQKEVLQSILIYFLGGYKEATHKGRLPYTLRAPAERLLE